MWARVIEFMLACWLAISPFVFRHGPEETWLWTNDLTASFVVAFLALLSFRHSLRRAHLFNLVVALWLVIAGFLGAGTPAAQNHVVLGLLLGIVAIVPSRASEPPLAWRQYLAERHT